MSSLHDFNPRTREGCDGAGTGSKSGDSRISIHAPVKGATTVCPLPHREICYFNPRTREGCDVLKKPKQGRFKNFNPRTREGCDGDRAHHPADTVISIHAPVKGATAGAGTVPLVSGISIHAPVKGATVVVPVQPAAATRFQSTHP